MTGGLTNSNINTRSYWNDRFASGNWEATGGRRQTAAFAQCQIEHLRVRPDFDGTLLDFGCGLGDAIPIYRSAFPHAKLVGVDLSDKAVDSCRQKYGALATFLRGDHTAVPSVDVIITSNVLEHLADDVNIARHLLSRCRELYVVVPYRERIIPGTEHVNSYDENYFRELGDYDYTVFLSHGWSFFGLALLYHVHLKNILRPYLAKPLLQQKKQIMFYFSDARTTVRPG